MPNVRERVDADKRKATAIYISQGKTAAGRRKRARLLRDYSPDDAREAARKRGLIGVRG